MVVLICEEKSVQRYIKIYHPRFFSLLQFLQLYKRRLTGLIVGLRPKNYLDFLANSITFVASLAMLFLNGKQTRPIY